MLSHDANALAAFEAGEKGLALGGASGMLEYMLRAQEASSAGQNTRYSQLAETCALMGDKNKALHYLQLAFNRHDTNLVALTVDPCFTQMRGEPAFRELVERVGVATPKQ
ncbi:MAG: hypothetical protein WB992_05015 [Bryobacteraceae bacterium]